jgi:hypothetical protein
VSRTINDDPAKYLMDELIRRVQYLRQSFIAYGYKRTDGYIAKGIISRLPTVWEMPCHRLRDIKTFSAFSCCCKRTVCLSKITVPVGRAISGNCGRSRELFVRMHALHRAERSPGRPRKRPDSGRYSWSALPFFMPHRPSPAPSTADSQHPRK